MSIHVKEAALRKKQAYDAYLKEVRGTNLTIGAIFDYMDEVYASDKRFNVLVFEKWLFDYAREN